MVKKFLKLFKSGEKGFTLIELLVVVAILGVLAAVAVPNVAQFMNAGNASAAKSELASVQTAVDATMTSASVGNITAVTAFPPDVSFGAFSVAASIRGGVTSLKGVYSIDADGTVHQTSYTP